MIRRTLEERRGISNSFDEVADDRVDWGYVIKLTILHRGIDFPSLCRYEVAQRLLATSHRTAGRMCQLGGRTDEPRLVANCLVKTVTSHRDRRCVGRFLERLGEGLGANV